MRTFLDYGIDYLRSVSQLFFLNNALFGILLLSLVCVFSPFAFACAFAISLLCYAYGIRYKTPRALTGSGLLVINGFFFGLAMAASFEPSLTFFALLILGGIALPVVTKAAHEVLQHWKLSPFVGPYILCVWLVWLCRNKVDLNYIPDIPYENFSSSLHLLSSPFLSMGRLLFLPNAWFGLLLFTLITAFSVRRGLFFIFGSVVAIIFARLLISDPNAWHGGALTFSGGLVALALAAQPEKFSWKTSLFFSGLSTLITIAAYEFFSDLGLQILSLPFLVTMWLAVLSRVPRMSVSWAPKDMQRTAMIGDYERAAV